MKKFIVAVVIMLLVLNIVVVFSQPSSPNIFVNGIEFSESGAFIQNDTTFVPLRMVSEALGANVEWDGDTRSVHIGLESGNNDTQVANIVQRISPSVVAIVGTIGGSAHRDALAGGSGVIIRSGGDILTNAHVVESMENIVVVLHDGSVYNATVRFIDEASDLAVIRIPRLGLPIVTFADSNEVNVGDTVVAIGTPLSFSLRNSATKGIISGMNRGLDSEYALIQTDAVINAGNSGGPLVNMQGQVVGINSSKFVGFGVEGIAFSIPSDTVRFVLAHFDRYGEVRRPTIGANLEEGWAARRGLPTREGLRVSLSFGQSRDEGLQNDDVITAIDGNLVHSFVDFNELMKRYTRGDTPAFYIRRGTEDLTLWLTLI